MAMSVIVCLVALAGTVFAPAGNPQISMTIVGKGSVVFDLYPGHAPNLVKHVLDLVDKKFYDKMGPKVLMPALA